VQDYATVSFKMETSSDDLTPRPALKTSSISMPPFLVVATLASGRSNYLRRSNPSVRIALLEKEIRVGVGTLRWQVVRYMQTAMQRIDENLERGRRGQGCRYRRILDETLSCLVWLERLSWVLRAESCLSPDT
jgi:hypothetical protein